MSAKTWYGLGWPAPAKLNLFLHITGRREDGYHNLQTVFQFVNYGDVLFFHIRDEPAVTRRFSLPNVPANKDLTVLAAKLLQREVGCPLGVEIENQKFLPMGGGLGGGSSNAATVLVALNKLWSCGLSVDKLAALGLQLGADVPVFVRGFSAWAEGVGEQLQPIVIDEPWYLIIRPNCEVATAEVFSDPALTRNSPQLRISAFHRQLGNDCETVVRAKYPAVAEALDWLGQFGEAHLTGTGSCIYAAFATEKDAFKVKQQIPTPWLGFVAKGMNRSPLHERLDQ